MFLCRRRLWRWAQCSLLLAVKSMTLAGALPLPGPTLASDFAAPNMLCCIRRLEWGPALQQQHDFACCWIKLPVYKAFAW